MELRQSRWLPKVLVRDSRETNGVAFAEFSVCVLAKRILPMLTRFEQVETNHKFRPSLQPLGPATEPVGVAPS
jgi:hypothetical protein